MHFIPNHDLILLAVFLCGIVVMRIFLKALPKDRSKSEIYVLKSSLFTPAERSFLGCLDSVLPPDTRLFAKVRLADLFDVERTPDRSARQSALNKINSKHVDFILCRIDDLSPILAIELDDKSHEREDRQKRDLFLDEIFAASNLPLIRFKVQKTYRTEDIAQKLNEAMS
jgi:hypothetical protein